MSQDTSTKRLIIASLATLLIYLSSQWNQLEYARSFFTNDTVISASSSPTPHIPIPVPTGYERVAHVADGDTITLENGEKVRYIGIDADELRETEGKSTCYGNQAKAANEALVLGRDVRLVPDKTNRDRYGRLLRYVFVKDANGTEQFVNELLVLMGAARSYPYKPDTAKQDILERAQNTAIQNVAGLWEACNVRQ